jgi:hypothetical protein
MTVKSFITLAPGAYPIKTHTFSEARPLTCDLKDINNDEKMSRFFEKVFSKFVLGSGSLTFVNSPNTLSWIHNIQQNSTHSGQYFVI